MGIIENFCPNPLTLQVFINNLLQRNRRSGPKNNFHSGPIGKNLTRISLNNLYRIVARFGSNLCFRSLAIEKTRHYSDPKIRKYSCILLNGLQYLVSVNLRVPALNSENLMLLSCFLTRETCPFSYNHFDYHLLTS